MSRGSRIVLVGGFVVVFAGILLLIYGLASPARREVPRPPELGGQKVPSKVFDIRFDRPYHLYCSFFSETPMVFRDCTIVGFTGRGEESAGSGRTSAVGVFSSPSGSGSYTYERYFEHWLVIRLADGRLAYIPPGSVKYIEESSPPKAAEPRGDEPKAQAR